MRDRGAGGDDVGAQSVHLEGGADLGDQLQCPVTQPHLRQVLLGRLDPAGQFFFRASKSGGEGVWVSVVAQPPADDLRAWRGIARRRHLDRQAESVQQLGTQLALLGVHRPDQRELRLVAE